MNYPMYGNSNQFYMQELQNMRDRIDKQMQQMQQSQQNQYQMQQQPVPTSLTQNFQLAPTQNNSELDAKYAENIDDVKNTLTLKNTFFVNKAMDLMWFKNVSGEIKKYSLIEIVELDPKDKEIAELKKQIENMQNIIINQNTKEIQPVITQSKAEKKSNKKE